MLFFAAMLVSSGFAIGGKTTSCDLAKNESLLAELFDEDAEYFKIYDHFLENFAWHQKLRSRLADAMKPGELYIDLAGGTGLVAEEVQKRFPKSEVVVLDTAENTLHFAKKRGLKTELADVREITVDGKKPAPNSVDGFTWNNGAYFLLEQEISDVLELSYLYLKPGTRFAASSFRPNSTAQKVSIKFRGIFHLVALAAKGIISWKSIKTIANATKKVDSGTKSTLLTAERFSEMAKDVGYHVVESDDSAYGGINFFVVLEK